jgi:hypothetical protein
MQESGHYHPVHGSHRLQLILLADSNNGASITPLIDRFTETVCW